MKTENTPENLANLLVQNRLKDISLLMHRAGIEINEAFFISEEDNFFLKMGWRLGCTFKLIDVAIDLCQNLSALQEVEEALYKVRERLGKSEIYADKIKDEDGNIDFFLLGYELGKINCLIEELKVKASRIAKDTLIEELKSSHTGR